MSNINKQNKIIEACHDQDKIILESMVPSNLISPQKIEMLHEQKIRNQGSNQKKRKNSKSPHCKLLQHGHAQVFSRQQSINRKSEIPNIHFEKENKYGNKMLEHGNIKTLKLEKPSFVNINQKGKKAFKIAPEVLSKFKDKVKRSKAIVKQETSDIINLDLGNMLETNQTVDQNQLLLTHARNDTVGPYFQITPNYSHPQRFLKGISNANIMLIQDDYIPMATTTLEDYHHSNYQQFETQSDNRLNDKATNPLQKEEKLLILQKQIYELQIEYLRELQKVQQHQTAAVVQNLQETIQAQDNKEKKKKKAKIRKDLKSDNISKKQEKEATHKNNIVSELEVKLELTSPKQQHRQPIQRNEVLQKISKSLCPDTLISVRHSFSPKSFVPRKTMDPQQIHKEISKRKSSGKRKSLPQKKIKKQKVDADQRNKTCGAASGPQMNCNKSDERKLERDRGFKSDLVYTMLLDTPLIDQSVISNFQRETQAQQNCQQPEYGEKLIDRFDTFLQLQNHQDQIKANQFEIEQLQNQNFQVIEEQKQRVTTSVNSQYNDQEDEVLTTYLSPDEYGGGLTNSEQYQSQCPPNVVKTSLPAIPFCNSPGKENYKSAGIIIEAISPFNAINSQGLLENEGFNSQPNLEVMGSLQLNTQLYLVDEPNINNIEQQNALIGTSNPLMLIEDDNCEEEESKSLYLENINNQPLKITEQPPLSKINTQSKDISVQADAFQIEHDAPIQNEKGQQTSLVLEKQDKNDRSGIFNYFRMQGNLDLSKLSEEYKALQENDDMQQEPFTKRTTGHQKYTESLPTKRVQNQSQSIYIRPLKASNGQSSLSQSIFERNSFQLFTSKVTKAFKAEAYLQGIIREINQAIDKRASKQQIQHKLNDSNVSLIKKRQIDIEKWASSQKKEVKLVQKQIMQGCKQLSNLIEYIMKEKTFLNASFKAILPKRSGSASNKTFQFGLYQNSRMNQDIKQSHKTKQSHTLSLKLDDYFSNHSEKTYHEIDNASQANKSPAMIILEKVQLDKEDEKPQIIDTASNIIVNLQTPPPNTHHVQEDEILSGSESSFSSFSSTSNVEPTKTLVFGNENSKDLELRVTAFEKVEAQFEVTQKDQRQQQFIIDTSMSHVEVYIDQIISLVKKDNDMKEKVIDVVCQAFYKDSLMILAHMQNPEILHGEEIVKDYALPQFELPYQPPVLPVDLYLNIEKSRLQTVTTENKNGENQTENEGQADLNSSFAIEMENIHNKAIFDGMNEALDGMRPYGLRGPPILWSKQSKMLTFKYGNATSLDDLLNDAKSKVMNWSKLQAGAVMPIQRINQSLNDSERKDNEFLREKRLQQLLKEEVENADPMWIDYEMEETQVKLDLADMIMSQLMNECIEKMNALQNRDFKDYQ